MRKLARTSLVALALFAAGPRAVSAQPSPGKGQPAPDEARARARALAEEGLALFRQGRHADALKRFEAAEALFHAPTNMRFIARSLVELGRLSEALAVYEELVSEAVPPDMPAEAAAFQRKAQAEAREELAALAPRVPSLTFALPAGARSPIVRVDGKIVPSHRLGEPYHVDAGEHVVAASAEGAPEVREKVTLAEGERRRVELALEVPDEASPAPSVASPGPARTAPAPEQGSLVPAAVAFGVGALGLGVGGVAGALALGKAGEVKDRCPDNVCPAAERPNAESAEGLATLSTIGFVVGGVGIATGIVLFAARGRGAPSDPSRAALRVGPGRIELSGSF